MRGSAYRCGGADCEILESMGELNLIRGPRISKLETRGLANTFFAGARDWCPNSSFVVTFIGLAFDVVAEST